MRLIDDDKLIHALCRDYTTGKKTLGQAIDEQPTAFDVDEVVQQLVMLIEDKCSESGDDWYTAQCLNETVEIVKGGGVEWVD